MAAIVLYEHAGYAGKSLPLTSATPDLTLRSFNDKVSSIEVKSGMWTVFQHVNYEGKSLTLRMGKYDIEYITKNLGNDVISSARPAEIILYQNARFQGKTLKLSVDTQSLVPEGFNDMVSSIEVTWGDWTVYQHVDYKGKSLDLKVGRYDMDFITKNMGNDVISSVRLTPSA
ncbi:epidermal differentiation-specific protein-like [Halichondria panicea]|uniref:epidermal differentiation-specific protein-like n=1 Tax=Halichondria panicea TaxID=6063 RepID=UPI00312B4AB8